MKKTEFCSAFLQEKYQLIEHESGLSIYVFPKRLTTSYALFSVKYGSVDNSYRNDQGELVCLPNGVAHFLEHKLFDNADGSDSFARFSEYGADANAYTTYNRTAYLFSCTENFDRSLEELLRFVTHPYFTSASVQKEQGIIAEEIRMYEDNPWERAFQNMLGAMYAIHPVRNNICGSVESIKRITHKLLYDCYQRFYRLSNMALVVCGDLSAEDVLEVADRVLPKDEKDQEVARVSVLDLEPVQKPYVEEEMQVAKPIFYLGFKDVIIGETPEQRLRRDAVMTLLGEILFSRSGDFYNRLFEEELITSAYSFGYSGGDDFAFFDLCGESDCPDVIKERLLLYLEQVRERGISQSDFERCKRVLYADEIRCYDSTEEIANRLLSFVFDGADMFSYPSVMQSVTIEETEALLADLLKPENLVLSVIKPFQKGSNRKDQQT